MEQKLLTFNLANGETGDEYLANTVDIEGEFLTVLMQNNNIIGIFKHITVHDRHYCDSIYGDADTNYEFAERIDMLLMDIMDTEN